MVIPVATQRQVCTALSVQRTVEIPRALFLDVGVVPVLCNDSFGQCRKQWKCRRCSSCGVVDVSVIMQRQVSGFPGRWSMSLLCCAGRRLGRLVPQITEEITEVIQLLCRSWRRAIDHGRNRDGSEVCVAGAVPAVMDVSVIMQRRGVLNSGGASDSVYRRSQWTFQLQQRRVRFQRRYGGDEGVFGLFLGHFSRSSRLSGVERQCMKN